MITKNKMVSVSYELRTEQNGELLEAAGADRPLDFICGQGQTLEYFEMNLLDKNEGDKFDFSIPAAHAYGLVNEDMIVDLPQEIFKDVEAEEMVVGHVLPMMDSVGRRLQVRSCLSVTRKYVSILIIPWPVKICFSRVRY
ncbi:MAG: FKBP-type peptidyl-prolyl cis-trans isomerase [Odoribacter splanchnicus]